MHRNIARFILLLAVTSGLVCNCVSALAVNPPNNSTTATHSYTSSSQSKEPEINYKQVQQLKQKGQLNKAKALALTHLKTNPKDGDMMLLLGTIYYQQKDYLAAKKILQQGLQLYPKYQDIRALLTRVELAFKNENNTSKSKEQAATKKTTRISYEQIKALKQEGHISEAKSLALTYLQSYPNDADVQLMLGSIYYQEHNYSAAEQILNSALTQYPHYQDVRMLLISTEIATQNYDAALATVNAGLARDPNDVELLNQKAYIYYLNKDYAKSTSTINKILTLNPQNQQANKLFNTIGDSNPRYTIGPNQVGVIQPMYYITDVREVWNFSTFYYTRDTDYGPVIASLNYSDRLHNSGTQEELQFYPQLNQSIYFYMDLAYADNLFLFPKYTIAGEGYVNLSHLFELSFGDKYRNIDLTYFHTYTASLSKEFGSYMLTFRPYYFSPKAGHTSIFYTGSVRRYFESRDHYIGITGGTGKTPDLADLQTINFIVLDDRMININYEFPMNHHQNVCDLGIGYEYQVFPSGTVRQFIGGTLGLRIRF